ncbi:hypothetical protein LSTR_LSTR010302 [Laodelphax striatellus]|uniref:Cytochrome b-c1 complex subunit 7 n=1 Tax=Laodelphax striatellus TaxID=195883 RepID=A0A482XSA2_LAOST|nr:hypothetical protein LSTR_LSTR010302 [Laodelphax striatellus]
MAGRSAVSKAPQAFSAFQKWVFNSYGYNKYGLLHDDCLQEEDDVDIQTAVERLPQPLMDARNYRTIRAFNLSMLQRYLPKEEWTKIEDDVKYLEPYIEEAKRERLEKEEWEANH